MLRVLTVIVLATCLATLGGNPLANPVAAVGEVNAVTNPNFEDSSSSIWFRTAYYGGGTVNVYDTAVSLSPTHSAMLNASKSTETCTASECKDAVRATVEQYVSSPTLDSLENRSDSLSAWLYVADPSTTGMPTYSIHIGIGFTDSNSIEYWYGISDLSNQRYNLGPIPRVGQWFQMARNLAADIQPLNIANPSGTRVSYIWFGAFGDIKRGEIAWVDDVSITFAPHPVALFTLKPAIGSAPLMVTFNASQSYETTVGSGSSSIIQTYEWSFGDVSPKATGRTVTHVYANPGTYRVVLTITDSFGRTSTSMSTVEVNSGDAAATLIALGGSAGALVFALLYFRRRNRP